MGGMPHASVRCDLDAGRSPVTATFCLIDVSGWDSGLQWISVMNLVSAPRCFMHAFQSAKPGMKEQRIGSNGRKPHPLSGTACAPPGRAFGGIDIGFRGLRGAGAGPGIGPDGCTIAGGGMGAGGIGPSDGLLPLPPSAAPTKPPAAGVADDPGCGPTAVRGGRMTGGGSGLGIHSRGGFAKRSLDGYSG